MLRWCSWNLWAIGPELRTRTDAARTTLERLAPDLCCLQEVRADGQLDVATELADALGLQLGRGPAVGADWWSARVGETLRVDNVVLSRWPIEQCDVLTLPGPAGSAEVRSALLARIESPEGALRVVSLQLSSSPLDSALRMAQLEVLADALLGSKRADETVLVAGDFNAEPDADEVRRFCGHTTAPMRSGFVALDLWRHAEVGETGWTWDQANPHVLATREPSSRIDYLMAGPTPAGVMPLVHCVERFATSSVGGVWASDHAGVVADLAI
jgi:endonuclease/exonuclease/phosphatase family metal-dependent hydrolase